MIRSDSGAINRAAVECRKRQIPPCNRHTADPSSQNAGLRGYPLWNGAKVLRPGSRCVARQGRPRQYCCLLSELVGFVYSLNYLPYAGTVV